MSCRCAYLDGPLNTGVNAWAVAIKAAKATVVDSFIVILFVLFYCFLKEKQQLVCLIGSISLGVDAGRA